MAAPVAPGVPVITSISPVVGQGRVNVTVEFGFTTPIPPAVYSVVAGRLNNPLDPGNRTALCTTAGTVQRGTVSISTGNIYYIWGAATANGQTVFSTPLVFNGASFGRPGTPFLVAQNPAENTYTWNFITEDIEGNPQYSFVFSPTNNTASPPAVNLPAIPTGAPGTYAVGPASIPVAGSPVYIWGRFTNSLGAEVFSDVPLVYTVGGTGTPPSGPTTSPFGVQPRSNTQLSVGFNTNGITGTLPFTVNCLASTSPTGPFDISCVVDLISPNNYLATTVDDLIPGTTYYFQTIISNGFLPNQLSVPSGPWPTTNDPQVSAPVPTLVQATQVTMRFSVPTSGFNPAVRTANLRWEAVDSSAVALANAVATTYLGVINTQHTWEGTVFGLTPGRQYFFQGQYVPVGLSSTTGLVTAQGNDFDLGYMPPRPWATPNPVIVSGVSQPWRQT
jgi:hypothetical protein